MSTLEPKYASLTMSDDEWFAINPKRFLRIRRATGWDSCHGLEMWQEEKYPLEKGEHAMLIVFCPNDGIYWRHGAVLTEDSELLNASKPTDEDLLPLIYEIFRELTEITDEKRRSLRFALQLCMKRGGRTNARGYT